MVFAIGHHTGAVIGYETQVDLYLPVCAHEDIVVFIQIESLVAEDRPVGLQMHLQSAVQHLGTGSEACPHLTVSIKIGHIGLQTTGQEGSFQQSGKHKLRVLLVVGHHSPINQFVPLGFQTEAHGIDTCAVCHE